MLDEYCDTLSDPALLEIALRLTELSLPVWNNHFSSHPEEEKKLARVMNEAARVPGARTLDTHFPETALSMIAKCYADSKTGPSSLERLRGNLEFAHLLCTSMQPLTNQRWDDAFPRSVRLVFTSVWNILSWLVYTQYSSSDENHIYVAINQAADALLSEGLFSVEQINAILAEYKNRIYSNEINLYSSRSERSKNSSAMQGFAENDACAFIATGQRAPGNAPADSQRQLVLRQMKEENKSIWDSDYEYFNGISRTYSYNQEQKSYWITEIDIIAASFCNERALSEEEMLSALSDFSLHHLRESGFTF